MRPAQATSLMQCSGKPCVYSEWLFYSMMPKLKIAGSRNYIGKVTGGVYASLEMMPVKPTGWDDDSKILPGVNMLTFLFIRGKCTTDKISDLFDVFEKVLTDINFKDSKSILQNSLKSSLSSKKSDIASRGHSFANRRIRGRYSVRCKWNLFASPCINRILEFYDTNLFPSH
jgi:Zn-dependent M16 (insulinase) family peptidase